MRTKVLGITAGVLRALRPRTATPPQTVVVLQFMMPLGCCVHGTVLYAGLKRARPGIKVVVVTRGLGLQTLKHDPNIDLLLEAPDPGNGVKTALACARAIRSTLKEKGVRPDLILQDGNNRRGTLAMLAGMLWLAPTAGFADMPELYDTPVAYNTDLSLIDNNLRLTALVGPQVEHLEPAVYFTAEDLRVARRLLAEANPEAKPVVAFVLQGSGGQRTGWHDDRFAAVLQHVEAAGYQTIFLGTAGDEAGIQRVRTVAQSSGVSLAGKTSIAEVSAVLTLCDLLISLDTGTLHVGRAAGLPLVVLGPCWQKPLEWLPVALNTARIIRGEDCTDVPTNYKLDDVSADRVIAAADELLRLYPPSPEARETRVRNRLVT